MADQQPFRQVEPEKKGLRRFALPVSIGLAIAIDASINGQRAPGKDPKDDRGQRPLTSL